MVRLATFTQDPNLYCARIFSTQQASLQTLTRLNEGSLDHFSQGRIAH